LHGNDFSSSQENIDYYADTATAYGADGADYRLAAENSYEAAKTAFDKSSDDFKSIGSDPTDDALAVLLALTYDTTKQAADAIKNTGNLIDLFTGKLVEKQIAVPAAATAERAQLSVFATQADSHFAALNAGERSVKSAEDAVAAATRVLSEREETLSKLENGAEDIDIRAAQTRVDAAAAALSGAQNAVRKTALVAPFAGTVTKVNVAVGEFASPGAPAVSLISSAGFELETNVSEIDVGKIKIGAKASVGLDTLGSGITFNATVISVNLSADKTNGVNSYHVVLAFDDNDPRFKAGLTANIAFLTGVADGVLAVPERSIITTGDQKSVLLINGSGVSETRPVTVGVYNDNGFVQILSGLSEGDKVASFGSN
jgi:RND family efflux transporter MFP subunit